MPGTGRRESGRFPASPSSAVTPFTEARWGCAAFRRPARDPAQGPARAGIRDTVHLRPAHRSGGFTLI